MTHPKDTTMGANDKLAATFHPGQAPAAPIDPASLPVGGCPALVRWLDDGDTGMRDATPQGIKFYGDTESTRIPWPDHVTIVRVWLDPDPLSPWEGWTRIDRPGPEHVGLVVGCRDTHGVWGQFVVGEASDKAVRAAGTTADWLRIGVGDWFLAPGQQPPTDPDTDLRKRVTDAVWPIVTDSTHGADLTQVVADLTALVREQPQTPDGRARCGQTWPHPQVSQPGPCVLAQGHEGEHAAYRGQRWPNQKEIR